MLDAPVSGGKTGAATRNLAVMVGGEREIYDRIKPILDAFGDKVFYAGTIGAGSICKLVHNMISRGVHQAIAEGLTLGVKAGVDAETLWECVRRGSRVACGICTRACRATSSARILTTRAGCWPGAQRYCSGH